jgi:hypothetical protein
MSLYEKLHKIQQSEIDFLEKIKQCFRYNPETGEITRSDRKNSNGSLDFYGYRIIKIKGRQYKAHRLAWFLHYGQMPIGVIDHINSIKDDNRILNLRDVTQTENVKFTQRKPNAETKQIGVHIDRTKGLKRCFATKFNRRTYRFGTVEEAVEFRRNQKCPV